MIGRVAISSDGKLIVPADLSGVSVWQLSQQASLFEARIAKTKPKPRKKDRPEPSGKEREAIDSAVQPLVEQGTKGAIRVAKILRNPDEEWKYAVLRLLHLLGPDAEPVLDALIDELRSDDTRIKQFALEVIRVIGPKAKRALPVVIEAAKKTTDFDDSRTGGRRQQCC